MAEEPRVHSGEIWDEFTGHVGALKDLVIGPEVPDTPLHRAEGSATCCATSRPASPCASSTTTRRIRRSAP